MSSWRVFPERGWSPIGNSLSGFGAGEGTYGISYAIDTGIAPLLNGRISARIRVAADRDARGAGVICRANDLRSFVGLYVVTDASTPDLWSLRLAAFKYGRLAAIAALRKPVTLAQNEFELALQFFSGEMVGQLVSDGQTSTITHLVPEIPFPGYAGLVRLYGSSVVAKNIHIEEISMKPVLPEEELDETIGTHQFRVFLSHAHADKELVRKVAAALREAGISYWIDEEQITFGDPIVTKIEEGLKASRYVVACLSENQAKSGWCRAEYGPILYREFSGDTSRRVIPLSLDGSDSVASIPLLLSDKMRADFTKQASFEAFIEFLRQGG